MTEMESHKKPIAAIDRLAARVASWLIRSRKSLSVLFVLVSVLLGVAALDVQGDPGFNKLIPISHEYMQAFLESTAIGSRARIASSSTCAGRAKVTSTMPSTWRCCARSPTRSSSRPA